MFRRHKNSLVPLIAAVLLASFLELRTRNAVTRLPASGSLSPNTNAAEPSVPQEAGPDKPEQGRSYFDIVFSKQQNSQYVYDIPFPLEKYVQKLEDYQGALLNSNEQNGIAAAIFPMGRSLQRNAAIKGLTNIQNNDPYFRYPRVVVGIDGENRRQDELKPNLKNKFYTGYNEKAEILEVISYNEDLGRFEYQIVNDYAAGKIPKVRYAERMLCLSCHQNQAPLFSKAPWSESNANASVAANLKRVLNSNDYHHIPILIDESITNRIDTSTDQANLVPAYQKIWKELCADAACKKAALKAILHLRLNSRYSGRDFETSQWVADFENQWQSKWPQGLAITSADIPNRDPRLDVSPTLAPVSPDLTVASHLPTISD